MKWFLALAILVHSTAIAAAQTAPIVAAASDGNATTILTSQCLKCHGPVEPKGGLDLSRRAAALKGGKSGVVLVPGSLDESSLLDRIADGEMPPNSPLAVASLSLFPLRPTGRCLPRRMRFSSRRTALRSRSASTARGRRTMPCGLTRTGAAASTR